METGHLKLDALIVDFLANRKKERRFSAITVRWLLESIRPVLLAEKTVLDLAVPINVVGDVHGQFIDLVRVFQLGGIPQDTRYLFLGDYVDRGTQSLDVMCLLMALKVRYPNNVFLLRGNHESPEMTEEFGFKEELLAKLKDESIWRQFCELFDCLPLAATVGGKFFCIHGGLSPELKTLEDLRTIERPVSIPQDGLLADVLWSDPNIRTDEWGPNPRGSTISWGLKVAQRFLEDNEMEYIVRGHQLALNGWCFPFLPDRSVITIFGASNYANTHQNEAAFMKINGNCSFEFYVLQPYIAALGNSVLSLDSLARPATARQRINRKKAVRNNKAAH